MPKKRAFQLDLSTWTKHSPFHYSRQFSSPPVRVDYYPRTNTCEHQQNGKIIANAVHHLRSFLRDAV